MNQAQLDDLFGSSPAGDIPAAKLRVRRESSRRDGPYGEIAELISLFGWKGKPFDAVAGTLRNRISAFGIDAIVAEVLQGEQPVQTGKECIVLHYSKTSKSASRIRDEIRQIGPGMYLGVVFWEKKRTINFALQF